MRRPKRRGKNWPDGEIKVDSPHGKRLGFTGARFHDYSYLWKRGREIIISAIASRPEGRGNLRHLFEKIERCGFTIVVPTPVGKMPAILRRWGFLMALEDAPEFGPGETCEVWRLPALLKMPPRTDLKHRIAVTDVVERTLGTFDDERADEIVDRVREERLSGDFVRGEHGPVMEEDL